jgi:hypothetical protein
MTSTVAGGTRPRGRADAGRNRLGRFLVLAFLLHLPLTPIGALVGLVSLLHVPEEAPKEQLHALPVSLLSPEEMAALGMTDPSSPKPTEPNQPSAASKDPSADLGEPPAIAEPKPKPKPKAKPKREREIPDGGAPERPDASPVHHEETRIAEHADAGAGTPPPVPASPPSGGGEPLALVGKAASVADPNANVRLLLFNDRIRALPIAPRISRLVARLPQWRSFFGPTGIDPIRDIDRVFVAGPQFRASGEVVAFLQYSVPTAVVRQAVDAIVKREPKGEWLSTKVPAARARADRSDRIFVLPKGHLLLMVPPHLQDDAIKKAPSLSFPAVGGQAAVVAFLGTPWRAFLGLNLPAEIPKSIASATLTVTAAEDGGAVIHIDAVDESPGAAQSDASLLTRIINVLTQRNVGAVGALLFGGKTLSLIEPVDLQAEGKIIRGDARVTARQLDRILGFAEGWVDMESGAPAPPASSVRPLRHTPASPPVL